MLIETYIALVLLAILVPVAIVLQADRVYQRARYQQRLAQRREQQ